MEDKISFGLTKDLLKQVRIEKAGCTGHNFDATLSRVIHEIEDRLVQILTQMEHEQLASGITTILEPK